jgi:hypothetical protein
MRKYQLLSALSILALLAGLFLVQGQYSTASHSDALKAATNTTSQFAQYYTFPAPPNPKTHVTAPEQFDIENNTPNTVYFSYLMQPVPYSQYEPVMDESNSLWIQGDRNWTQYAVVPQGAVVPILAISPAEGAGDINIIDSTGIPLKYNYFFYPDSRLLFYADSLGQHTMTFAINGKMSNQVIIDVTGPYQPARYFLPISTAASDYMRIAKSNNPEEPEYESAI